MSASIKELVNELSDHLGQVAGVNTVVGDPIIADGITLIPVSRVSVGVCSGGTDFDGKKENSPVKFGGGAGGGVAVTPMGFLVVNNGSVRFVNIGTQNPSPVEHALDVAPELVSRITGVIDRFKKNKE